MASKPENLEEQSGPVQSSERQSSNQWLDRQWQRDD
uniref:Uncharacterized protein n=1 Tax=Romanomermis culicivorax TaxID=13658 RepID=A0A915KHZ7_ROMCU